jgi:hypothetical protein
MHTRLTITITASMFSGSFRSRHSCPAEFTTATQHTRKIHQTTAIGTPQHTHAILQTHIPVRSCKRRTTCSVPFKGRPSQAVAFHARTMQQITSSLHAAATTRRIELASFCLVKVYLQLCSASKWEHMALQSVTDRRVPKHPLHAIRTQQN